VFAVAVLFSVSAITLSLSYFAAVFLPLFFCSAGVVPLELDPTHTGISRTSSFLGFQSQASEGINLRGRLGALGCDELHEFLCVLDPQDDDSV